MKIIKKMKRINDISLDIRATFWFFICNVLQKGIQYVTLPLFSRIMTVEEYGSYVVFLSWLSVIQIFATLNLSAGIFMTGMATYDTKRDEYTTNMVGLNFFCVVFASIIYGLCYPFLKTVVDLKNSLVMIIFIHSFFSPCFLFWSARERFELKYRELTFVTILCSLASPVISIAFIYIISDKTFALCMGYISGQVLMGIYCFFKVFAKNKYLFNYHIWKEAIEFSLPLIPHYLSYVVLGQADRLMINSICGQFYAGIYGLAYQISNSMNLIASALDASYSPAIYMALKRPECNIKKKINQILLFYVIIATGITLVAPEILLVFGSEKYINAKWVMPSIILSSYFLFLAGLFMKAEFYFKKNMYITFASVSIAVLNILLNKLFIEKYGYIAAGYTTFFCYMMFAYIHYIFMRNTLIKNKIKVQIFDIKIIVTISIGVIVATGTVTVLYILPIYIRYIIISLIMTLLILKRDRIICILKKK